MMGKIRRNSGQVTTLVVFKFSRNQYFVAITKNTHFSPRLNYRSKGFRLNEKITILSSVLVTSVVNDIWIIRGSIKGTAEDNTERRRCSANELAIFSARNNWRVEVMLDVSVAPGNKSKAAHWKSEGGIFQITWQKRPNHGSC